MISPVNCAVKNLRRLVNSTINVLKETPRWLRLVDETVSLRGQPAGVCGIIWVIGQPHLCKRDDIMIMFTYIIGDEIRLISDGSCFKQSKVCAVQRIG